MVVFSVNTAGQRIDNLLVSVANGLLLDERSVVLLL
jgi:hypothetical protein